ncbi:UDP:flavonoid glycosyltransferase YjiC, YdhE family [Rhizobium aethiopicum]|uniref:UDP:flavonoid glycosyltransferase YjiC, YdhE family n=1 Tax=Rhizobium aethiopicum TaxID=1138170 RepID=A0A1C3Y255_9HYPH|nr:MULTISPECIES: glycosyltransferase [Rhizobium]SCB58551.1 UDP:flavonoid glycosyltransferase YjiC, YdhE family [Rhizobium aethiopicum]
MRVSIHTLGTRGDVQPYIALALGLIERGHRVQLAAPVQFESMVQDHGIGFAPLPGEFLALLDTPEGKAAIAGSKGFGSGIKLLKYVRPMMRTLLDAEWKAAQAFTPDIFVHHPKAMAVPHMAEALHRPFILASPLPGFTPTSAFPSPMLPFKDLGWFNRISHLAAIRGADLLFGKLLSNWRAEQLGLPRRRMPAIASDGTLYAYSRHVVPVPPDWGSDVLVSGYWFLDSKNWRPSDELAAFLTEGEPPVYVGFGSMPGVDPVRMTAIIVEALARRGKRSILALGGGALSAEDRSGHVHVVRDAPHDRVFHEVSAVIHHGGAGTTAAALRAGKPMIICPFFGDQPFWGRRITDLGVGLSLERRALTVESLTAALAAMDDTLMRRRAEAVGARIRSEDGVATAVGFIEAAANKRQAHPSK